jgi:hypothetical protein
MFGPVHGSSMENLVNYAGALFQRASNYVSRFGAVDALFVTSDPVIIVITVSLASKRRI